LSANPFSEVKIFLDACSKNESYDNGLQISPLSKSQNLLKGISEQTSDQTLPALRENASANATIAKKHKNHDKEGCLTKNWHTGPLISVAFCKKHVDMSTADASPTLKHKVLLICLK
jgi:hypothetical protein